MISNQYLFYFPQKASRVGHELPKDESVNHFFETAFPIQEGKVGKCFSNSSQPKHLESQARPITLSLRYIASTRNHRLRIIYNKRNEFIQVLNKYILYKFL